jgi:hypothetical protein
LKRLSLPFERLLIVGLMMLPTTVGAGPLVTRDPLPGTPAAIGTGIGVAVVDSGIARHGALVGKVLALVNVATAESVAIDAFGRGSQIAGIMAGSTSSSPTPLDAIGVISLSPGVVGPQPPLMPSPATSPLGRASDRGHRHAAPWKPRAIVHDILPI